METRTRGKKKQNPSPPHQAAVLGSILHGNVKCLAPDSRPHQRAVATKSHYLNHRVSHRSSPVFTFHRTDFPSLIAAPTWTRHYFHTVTLNGLWFGFPADGPRRDDCARQQKGNNVMFPRAGYSGEVTACVTFSRPFPQASDESAELFQHVRIKRIHFDEPL